MTNKKLYETEVNRYYKAAEKILMEDGELHPTMIMFTSTNVTVIPMYLGKEKGKVMFLMSMRALAKRLGAEAVITISEAWFVHVIKKPDEEWDEDISNAEKIIGCMPVDHEDRQESLFLSCSMKGQPSIMVRGLMIRNQAGKLIKVIRVEDLDGSGNAKLGGRMVDMCGNDIPDDHQCMKQSIDSARAALYLMIHAQPDVDPNILKRYKKAFKRAMH